MGGLFALGHVYSAFYTDWCASVVYESLEGCVAKMDMGKIFIRVFRDYHAPLRFELDLKFFLWRSTGILVFGPRCQ